MEKRIHPLFQLVLWTIQTAWISFPLSIHQELGTAEGSMGWEQWDFCCARVQLDGVLPPQAFLWGFFGINPTGVICITTALGSAPFVPENRILHVNSLRGTYQTNQALH